MDKRQFEEQKKELLGKALTNLDQIKNNLNVLNRNLEVLNSIGTQFEAPAALWDSFHKAIGTSDEEMEQEKETVQTATSQPGPSLT